MKKDVASPDVSPPREQGIIVLAAQHFGVDSNKVMAVLKNTCFKTAAGEPEATDAEVAGLLVVAKAHNLNPFLREIFAFRNKTGGIVPVVGVDGWTRIINEHPQLDGFEFRYASGDNDGEWIECVIYRKDRCKPIVVREFMDECKRETGPWKSHPSRMLRHKALIQCARIAFGFAGIYDEDEAERIVERDITPAARQRPAALQEPGGAEEEISVDQKIMPAHEKILRSALEHATITDTELCKKFSIEKLPDLPFVKLNEAMAWVQNPG